MTVGVVSDFQTWPEAAGFSLKLIDDDGETARMFTRDGRGEIDIAAPPVGGPIPPEGQRSMTIVPVSFATLEQARRAAKILGEAFDAVRAIEQEEPPDQSTCDHVAPPRFFARNVVKHRVCELCAAYLGEVNVRP